MRDTIREISDYINEGLPIVIFVTWLLMVVLIIKLLVSGAIR